MTQGTVIKHDMHGGYLHNIAIFTVEYICVEKGFKILDGDAWRHKTISPGVPDVVYERIFKVKKDGKTYQQRELNVVEIDTNGSATSEYKKWVQFVRDNPGYELVYIDLSKWIANSNKPELEQLYDFISARMPG